MKLFENNLKLQSQIDAQMIEKRYILNRLVKLYANLECDFEQNSATTTIVDDENCDKLFDHIEKKCEQLSGDHQKCLHKVEILENEIDRLR
jgi:hypothetical protein